MNLKIARYYYENKLSLENGARYISTAYYSVKPGHLQSKNKSTINLPHCKKKNRNSLNFSSKRSTTPGKR